MSVLVYRFVPTSFPWGTLAANLSGCFLIGALWALSQRAPFPTGVGLFVFTGMIGAFTTFSTYGLESLQLMQDGKVGLGLANVALSTLGGIALVAAGMAAMRAVLHATSSAG